MRVCCRILKELMFSSSVKSTDVIHEFRAGNFSAVDSLITLFEDFFGPRAFWHSVVIIKAFACYLPEILIE